MPVYLPESADFEFKGSEYVPVLPAVFSFGQDNGYALPPSLVTSLTSTWSRPSAAADAGAVAGWGAVGRRDAAGVSGWGFGQVVDLQRGAPWSGVPAKDSSTDLEWGTASAMDGAATRAQWGDLPAKDLGVAPGWDQSIQPVEWQVRLVYNPRVPAKDATTRGRYQRSAEYRARTLQQQSSQLYAPPQPLAFAFDGGLYTPAVNGAVFFTFALPATVAGQIGPVDASTRLPIRPARRVNLFSRLLWGRATPLDPVPTGIEYPDYEGPITIITPPAEPDILETYMIANSVSVVVLPDRVPLEATNLRIGRDIDSFAWTLSANLFGRTSLNQVRPDASGPKEVEVTINGHVWVFLIERYSGTGQLGKEAYGITGVSRTQLLAAPYAPPRSKVNTADINAELAASNELINTGFTLNWDSYTLGPPDWTLPAGAFSYQSQTPMQVIAALAETAGGVVSPAMASDELTILPRYREPVWQWSSAVMDRIIPAAIISDWGSEWQPQPDWNGCYVSGTNYGVAVDVRRAGTAGDNPAPDVFADWITGTEVARSRGIAEICKGGQQEIVTLNLPLFPAETAPGLVTPAQLCEVRDVDETWRGLCLSTEITAEGVGASRVKQSIRLERHHAEGA